MFAVSALAAIAHFHFAPVRGDGVYALHWDTRMFDTLWTYWIWALGPIYWVGILLTGAVASLLTWAAWRREWLGWFGIAWFVITIGSYLPLSDHKMDYYLTVPAIGVAIFGAWALEWAWRSERVWRAAALGAIAIYLLASAPHAWAVVQWNHARGMRAEDVVLGVAEIHATQPGKIILLDGVDADLFWSGIADLPFRAMEIPHVYLTPGSEWTLYTLPEAVTLRALREGRAVVYQVSGSALSNVTSRYGAMAEALWKPGEPRFINLGDDVFADYLGAGWDRCGDGFRMLRETGTVHMGGARRAGERLYIGVFRTGAFDLGVGVNGAAADTRVVHRDGDLTELAADAGAQPEMEVTLTNREREPLRFGYLEIR